MYYFSISDKCGGSMKKITAIFYLLILSCLVLVARPVSVSEAISVAGRFLPDKTISQTRQIHEGLFLHRFSGGGFLLMSADDAFPAILAFSEGGSTEKMHPAFLDFCAQYSREINETAADKNRKHPSWSAVPVLSKTGVQTEIQAMISSTWNQEPYYNDQFPYFLESGYTDRRAYAGCVAVAAGQLLRYYGHPGRGYGRRTYYSEDMLSIQSAWFDTTVYNWDLMPDSLCTRNGVLTADDAEVAAVSQLLYQLAVSVEMEMKTDGSASSFDDLIYALVSYFDYSPQMRLLSKSQYDAESWHSMLKTELEAGKPLPYSGQSSSSGGHAFLCDGYKVLSDTLNYFHFNWGWGGNYDGWFLLSALTPGSGYDFSNEQQAVFDISVNADPFTRLAYSGFEGWQSSWIYDGYGFIEENGSYDMVHSGNYAYSFNAAEQWLITPKIYLADSDSIRLSFWAKMLSSGKQCKVMLSQTDTLRSSFTVELGTIAPHDANWSKYVYDLSAYKNSGIHIGFRYTSADGYIAIDDFTISTAKIESAVFREVPETFTLLRNYPNPFNPATQIVFELAFPADVRLNIFDIRGNLIQTVSKGRREPGIHRYSWDASAYPSGIYLYSLVLDGKTAQTQKMLLVK
jgi:hypothetical protein